MDGVLHSVRRTRQATARPVEAVVGCLGREWYGVGARSGECRSEGGEDAEVGVQLDALDPSHPERRQSGLVLQPAEAPLDGATATVEVTPPLRLARDQRMQTARLDPDAPGRAVRVARPSRRSRRAAPLRP